MVLLVVDTQKLLVNSKLYKVHLEEQVCWNT